MAKNLALILLLLPVASGQAQTTCFTSPQGTTLCSSPEGVIHGSTNSIGSSIYRDDRGNQLDYQADPTGKASVQLPGGEIIQWSHPAADQQPDPGAAVPGDPPRPLRGTAAPGTGGLLPPDHLNGSH